jgi:hypothetical protein
MKPHAIGYNQDQRESEYNLDQRESEYNLDQRESGYNLDQRESGYNLDHFFKGTNVMINVIVESLITKIPKFFLFFWFYFLVGGYGGNPQFLFEFCFLNGGV